MIQVIPAVLEQTFEAVQKKVKRIKPFSSIIQLDVMDGVFVPNTTFNNPEQAATLDIVMELHLMIEKPELFVPRWSVPNVQRMIVHYEATANVGQMIKQIRGLGKEVGIAINPATSSHVLKDYVDDIDLVLVMGVDPGFSGQDFHYDVLEKIKEVKRLRPEVLVEVDGGVNGYTRKRIVDAGVDILAAASFIWNSDDIAGAINVLQNGKAPE